MRFEYRGWVADVDVEATRRAYVEGRLGAAVECGCDECANYIAARDAGYIFPDEVATLLSDMGVDLARESEVVVGGKVGRDSVVYSGWFNVAGQLVSASGGPTEVEPGFDLYPMEEGALVDDSFGDVPVFRVEFEVLAPLMNQSKRKR